MTLFMTKRLKRHWTIWGVLSCLLATGTCLHYLARVSSSATLLLVPGQEIHVSVIRPFPDPLRMVLEFPELTPEYLAHVSLNNSHYREQLEAEEVLLSVLTEKGTYLYRSGKQPVMYHPELAKRLYSASGYKIPIGQRLLTVKVEEVGLKLQGQKALLEIDAPVGFKSGSSEPIYGWLWPFWLWPVGAILLFVYGLILFCILIKPGYNADDPG